MRLLKLNNQRPLPALGIITSVVELSHYDMIYIYHHLKENAFLTLKRDYNHIWDKEAVAVYYKGFKLGYVSARSQKMVAKYIDKGDIVSARIRTVYKQKYLPLSGMDIEIMVD